ncbi:MAG: hypothetical protein ABMA13_21820 [Chthoniobacteraceae bacterium]
MKLAALFAAVTVTAFAATPQTLVFNGKAGPGKGRHIVLLSGDEEYRSEEALPQLARILSERHGFKCTVVFAIDKKTGEIDPTAGDNAPGVEALGSADLCIMALRFRAWPDEQMKHFADYYLAGKPIIALRTSTHAFNYDKKESAYAKYGYNSKVWPGGFGKQVLGETWVSHHGKHKVEGTRGIIEAATRDVPILRGVGDIFGDTDVYGATPPDDAIVLVRGQVTATLDPASPPVADAKKNDPMQPVVWLRTPVNEAGKTNKIFTTTMGSATDLKNEGLRRLLVNACYAFNGLEVPAKADVSFVGDFQPTFYGFGTFKKGVKPADLAK